MKINILSVMWGAGWGADHVSSLLRCNISLLTHGPIKEGRLRRDSVTLAGIL